MLSDQVTDAFLEAGRQFAGIDEFRLRDLLDSISSKGVTQKDIGKALGITAGHIGRLMRGYPISVRDHSLRRLHELSGVELKRLIVANALNAHPDEVEVSLEGDWATSPCRARVGTGISGQENRAPAVNHPAEPDGAWEQRGVIGYCRLPLSTFNDAFYDTLSGNLMLHASWEPVTDYKRLPSLAGLDQLVFVRVSSPLMELSIGEISIGERVMPRGSIVEVELTSPTQIANGAIVYVQFGNEPADFYCYESTQSAAIFTPRNSKYPARIMRTTRDNTEYRIIGVATRIVEKTL